MNNKQIAIFLTGSYLFVRCEVFEHAFDRLFFQLQAFHVVQSGSMPPFLFDVITLTSDVIEIFLVVSMVAFAFRWLLGIWKSC